MLKYLYEVQSKKRKSGLHKIKLTLEDKLLILLQYYRENRTFYAMAIDYNVNETTIVRSIYWVEDVLAKNCNEFKLPSKRRLLDNNMEYEIFVVDATETPIERPLIKSNKKNKKEINKEKINKEEINKKEINKEETKVKVKEKE